MPITTSELKTRSGHLVLRAQFTSEVTVADATEFRAKVVTGGAYAGCGHLVVGNVTGISGAVRKILSEQETSVGNPAPVAVVLESALARMAAALVLRLANNGNTEFFRGEPEALTWLDERMGPYLARRAAR